MSSGRVTNIFLVIFPSIHGMFWCSNTVDLSDLYCKENRDDEGTTWDNACADAPYTKPCPTGYTGEVTRYCTEDGKWEEPDYDDCINDTLQSLKDEVYDLEKDANISTILSKLLEATDEKLSTAEVELVVDFLTRISQFGDFVDEPNEVYENFLETASNLVDDNDTKSWQRMNDSGAEELLGIVERLASDFSNRSFNSDALDTKNIDVNVGNKLPIDLPHPDSDSRQDNQTFGTRMLLPVQGGDSDYKYAAVFYRNLSGVLPRKVISDGQIVNKDKYDIGPVVMSLQLFPTPNNLSAPVRLFFGGAFDTKHKTPICSYWNFSVRSSSGNRTGAWSRDGCSMVSRNSSGIVCECNHLTNFAILMAPAEISDIGAISIISAVGCAVSLACLVVTVIGHALLWRYVRSRRTNVLMNICIALILSYVIFLAGVDRTENKTVCTTVAALMHYFYLVVFFLMLMEGIELAVTFLIVFSTKSRLKWLLPLAWLIPAGIVGASLAISRLRGYGNEKFCWLSVHDGLIWAFAGPAVLVIVINVIIIVIIVKIMFSASVLRTKTNKEKAKTTLRSLAVLMPLTGVTWILGIFSVNNDLVVFQYLFTIFTSLQGLFIFIFHFLLNKQIRNGIRASIKRRKDLSTSLSNIKSTSGQMSRSLPEETTKL